MAQDSGRKQVSGSKVAAFMAIVFAGVAAHLCYEYNKKPETPDEKFSALYQQFQRAVVPVTAEAYAQGFKASDALGGSNPASPENRSHYAVAAIASNVRDIKVIVTDNKGQESSFYILGGPEKTSPANVATNGFNPPVVEVIEAPAARP